MPRRARYLENNGYYHVISRSVNQTWVFKDAEDFQKFRILVRDAKLKFPVRLFHYALMNTHFHFVLQVSKKELLAKHLAYIKWNYTQWMRRKYGWRGPLWRERFKSLPIENELYLAACGHYVEFNPVRAGLCANPEKYLYSSARKYIAGIADDLVDNYEMPTLPPMLMSVAQSSVGVLADILFAGTLPIGSSSLPDNLPVPKVTVT